MSKTTLIQVQVENDAFVARCPHVPDDAYNQASHPTDGPAAIAALIRQVREYRRKHQFDRQPVPWVSEVTPLEGADQTLHISGLWPREIAEQASEPETTEQEETE